MPRTCGLLFFVVMVVGTSSCRILSQDVACRLNRDCPRDVGLGFCDLPEDSDGGVGVCVGEDPDPPAPRDGGDGVPFPFLDGGTPDAS